MKLSDLTPSQVEELRNWKTAGVLAAPEDLINKPNHYHKGGFDIYEIMQAKLTPEEYRGFCKGNILKYTLRADLKGGVQDLEKAHFNQERLIESYKGIKYVPKHKQEATVYDENSPAFIAGKIENIILNSKISMEQGEEIVFWLDELRKS